MGNPNYNGSLSLHYAAGGAGDTDESGTGTNKDAHQLSVLWQKDASARYLLRVCETIVVQAVYGERHVMCSLCKS